MCASAELMLRPTIDMSDMKRSENVQTAWMQIVSLFDKVELELMEWRNAKMGNMLFTSNWKPTVRGALADLEQSIAEYQKRNDIPIGTEKIISYQILKDDDPSHPAQPASWMYTALVNPGVQEVGSPEPQKWNWTQGIPSGNEGVE